MSSPHLKRAKSGRSVPKLDIWTGCWCVNYPPHVESLVEWMQDGPMLLPDVYAVCVIGGGRSWTDALQLVMREYTLLGVKHEGSLGMMVFVKKEVEPLSWAFQTAAATSSVGSAVLMTFRVQDSALSFVSTDVKPAGGDLESAVRLLRELHLDSGDFIHCADACFLLGDFGSSFAAPRKQVVELVEHEEWHTLRQLDTLHRAVKDDRILLRFLESPPTYPPHYPVRVGAEYDLDWSADVLPSYRTRILWHQLPEVGLTQTSEHLTLSVFDSDTKPLFATFALTLRSRPPADGEQEYVSYFPEPLASVAATHGVTMAALRERNMLAEGVEMLKTGQRLFIPPIVIPDGQSWPILQITGLRVKNLGSSAVDESYNARLHFSGDWMLLEDGHVDCSTPLKRSTRAPRWADGDVPYFQAKRFLRFITRSFLEQQYLIVKATHETLSGKLVDLGSVALPLRPAIRNKTRCYTFREMLSNYGTAAGMLSGKLHIAWPDGVEAWHKVQTMAGEEMGLHEDGAAVPAGVRRLRGLEREDSKDEIAEARVILSQRVPCAKRGRTLGRLKFQWALVLATERKLQLFEGAEPTEDDSDLLAEYSLTGKEVITPLSAKQLSELRNRKHKVTCGFQIEHLRDEDDTERPPIYILPPSFTAAEVLKQGVQGIGVIYYRLSAPVRKLVMTCLLYLRSYGLRERGLFSVTGGRDAVRELRESLLADGIGDGHPDVHTVAGVLKAELRNNPLLYYAFFKHYRPDEEVSTRLEYLNSRIADFTAQHRQVLAAMFGLLQDLVSRADVTGLTTKVLADLMMPSLVGSIAKSVLPAIAANRWSVSLVADLIDNASTIFSDGGSTEFDEMVGRITSMSEAHAVEKAEKKRKTFRGRVRSLLLGSPRPLTPGSTRRKKRKKSRLAEVVSAAVRSRSGSTGSPLFGSGKRMARSDTGAEKRGGDVATELMGGDMADSAPMLAPPGTPKTTVDASLGKPREGSLPTTGSMSSPRKKKKLEYLAGSKPMDLLFGGSVVAEGSSDDDSEDEAVVTLYSPKPAGGPDTPRSARRSVWRLTPDLMSSGSGLGGVEAELKNRGRFACESDARWAEFHAALSKFDKATRKGKRRPASKLWQRMAAVELPTIAVNLDRGAEQLDLAKSSAVSAEIYCAKHRLQTVAEPAVEADMDQAAAAWLSKELRRSTKKLASSSLLSAVRSLGPVSSTAASSLATSVCW
eukprot:PLAT6431.1.p1 GENE.PLAT6431.1~~PLAT6431.1.p1  ORF type:complete len:1210 (+),score=440.14 PLAT6431.1:3-3632(+)